MSLPRGSRAIMRLNEMGWMRWVQSESGRAGGGMAVECCVVLLDVSSSSGRFGDSEQ